MSPTTQQSGAPPPGERPAPDDPSRRQAAGQTQDIPTADIARQLRRRRAASWRCPPLADGRRDPLDRSAEPLTDAELDSWRATWRHLHALGLPTVVPQRVLAAAHAHRCPCRRDAA